MTNLSVACVGAGYFSQFHYSAWSRIPSINIVGSMDTTIESAIATGFAGFDDLATMVSNTTPDILDIITPPTSHLALIKLALEQPHKPKLIICQKPFCHSLAAARDKDAGIPLVVHENFRFQPWYRCIKRAIDSNLIGQLHQITFRLRTGDGQGKKAYLDRQPYFQSMPKFLIHETGVHWIDTFRYLMGEPEAVYADLRQMNPSIAGEDAGYMLFEFSNGKRAVFDGNRLLDHAAENHRLTLGECLVEGTTGTLELSGDGVVTYREFGKLTKTRLLEAQDWPGFGGDCVYALQNHIVKAMQGTATLENLAENYLRVLEVESAVYQSAQRQVRVRL